MKRMFSTGIILLCVQSIYSMDNNAQVCVEYIVQVPDNLADCFEKSLKEENTPFTLTLENNAISQQSCTISNIRFWYKTDIEKNFYLGYAYGICTGVLAIIIPLVGFLWYENIHKDLPPAVY